jgi:hypothetical protein
MRVRQYENRQLISKQDSNAAGAEPNLAVSSISDELFAKPERARSAVGDIADRGELDGASWPPGSGLLATVRVRAD